MSKRKKGEMTPNAFESARTEGTGEVEAQVVPSKRKKLQQQEGVEDTLEMFLRSEKVLHMPWLKQFYEAMTSRETQLAWFQFRLCYEVNSCWEPDNLIEKVLNEWKFYYRYLEPYNIPNFIAGITTEGLQQLYNRIKDDYYLSEVVGGYEEGHFKQHFKCENDDERFTNPIHEKKVEEARRLYDEWIRKKKYIDKDRTPFNMFTNAFGEWKREWKSEGAPEKQKLTKYETVLDFLVKKEDQVESDYYVPLMDEIVGVITSIDWDNAPENISLRALTSLLHVCYYQRDLLKANILKKILSLDLKSIGKDNVEKYLLPQVETIFLMADTTLPQVRIYNNSLIKKIKDVFPGLWP